MELREAIKVLDSDAHARDLDNDIRHYLPEPYRSQKSSFIPERALRSKSWAARWDGRAPRSRSGWQRWTPSRSTPR